IIGAQQVLRGRRRVGLVTELMSIRSGQEQVSENACATHNHQKHDCGQACSLHAACPRNLWPRRSQAEFAKRVTSVTIIVRFTSRGKSRARAAFHASWPMPGRSHSASAGMAAVSARLTEIPASANT